MSDKLIQSGSLSGEIRAEGRLSGTIYMPKEKEVVKYANAPQIGSVTLLKDAWVGEDNLYHQVVEIDGVAVNSQVDLTPSVEQLLVFYEKDITFVTKNLGGVVTVYAVGQKPTRDYTVQVTITEVNVQSGAIWGVTVGTTMNPESIAAKVKVDGELSAMSANAVQNQVVATKFAEVETTIGNIDVLLGTI